MGERATRAISACGHPLRLMPGVLPEDFAVFADAEQVSGWGNKAAAEILRKAYEAERLAAQMKPLEAA